MLHCVIPHLVGGALHIGRNLRYYVCGCHAVSHRYLGISGSLEANYGFYNKDDCDDSSPSTMQSFCHTARADNDVVGTDKESTRFARRGRSRC